MRDEPFPIRREIVFERGNNRREHTADALAHDFCCFSNFLILNSSFYLLRHFFLLNS